MFDCERVSVGAGCWCHHCRAPIEGEAHARELRPSISFLFCERCCFSCRPAWTPRTGWQLPEVQL